MQRYLRCVYSSSLYSMFCLYSDQRPISSKRPTSRVLEANRDADIDADIGQATTGRQTKIDLQCILPTDRNIQITPFQMLFH